MSSKIWFITGASKGFGRVWTEAALKRGDKVAATARNLDDLAELVSQYGENVLPIKLDVTDRTAGMAAIQQTNDHFGRLDVVINNAGYGHFGAIEEISEEEARSQLETNLFGALWITQAAIPIMRAQGSGHIMQVSSVGGIVAFPTVGLYHASKWALEGFSESLSQEVAGFGIHVTLIEPGGYATDWGGSSAAHSQPIAAYEPIKTKLAEQFASRPGGDPNATADAILAVVDAEKPPLRLILGSVPLPLIQQRYAQRLDTWTEWKTVSDTAQGN